MRGPGMGGPGMGGPGRGNMMDRPMGPLSPEQFVERAMRYDKDEDGKKEKLIVYIQPIDKQGDIIKVLGSVDVELWDLNKDAGQAKLGRWHVGLDELKKNWFTTLIGGNYRLMFDITDKVTDFTEPLTVKVTFTDYLTGRVFKEQRVIKPD